MSEASEEDLPPESAPPPDADAASAQPILDYGTGLENRLHLLAVFPSESEAHLAALLLQGEGIDAQVGPSATLHGMGARSAGLFVWPNQAEDAAKLLAPTPAGRFIQPQSLPPVASQANPGTPGDEWSAIWSAANPQEAALAVAWLTEQGFAARVDAENIATLGAWAGSGPGTSTRVQVRANDATAAKELLAQSEQRRRERSKLSSPRCPVCDAISAARIAPPGRWLGWGLIGLSAVLMLMQAAVCFPIAGLGVALLFWPMTPKWKCPNGHVWRAPVPDELLSDELRPNELPNNEKEELVDER